jgi:hypothetical protein
MTKEKEIIRKTDLKSSARLLLRACEKLSKMNTKNLEATDKLLFIDFLLTYKNYMELFKTKE